MSMFFVLLFLGAKISIYFAGAIVLYFYDILFCFGVYEVFGLFLDVVKKTFIWQWIVEKN